MEAPAVGTLITFRKVREADVDVDAGFSRRVVSDCIDVDSLINDWIYRRQGSPSQGMAQHFAGASKLLESSRLFPPNMRLISRMRGCSRRRKTGWISTAAKFSTRPPSWPTVPTLTSLLSRSGHRVRDVNGQSELGLRRDVYIDGAGFSRTARCDQFAERLARYPRCLSDHRALAAEQSHLLHSEPLMGLAYDEIAIVLRGGNFSGGAPKVAAVYPAHALDFSRFLDFAGQLFGLHPAGITISGQAFC